MAHAPEPRSIPAAVELERAVLGAILLDADQLIAVTEVLPTAAGGWFYHEAHRLIYDAMLTLVERAEPVDLYTVTDALYRRGQLEKVGGSTYLANLMEEVVTTANVGYHARLLRDKALYRSLINVATHLSTSAHEQDDLPALIDSTQHVLAELAGVQSTSAFVTLNTLMTQSIHEAEHARDHQAQGLLSGFHDLDAMTNGFQNSDLIIVAARPAMGKTSLGLQFAIHAASGHAALPVAIFSLEMSKEQLSMRMLCSASRTDSQRVRRGFLSLPEWGPLMDTSNRLSYLPILIDDTPSLTVMDVRARTKRLQREHGLGMILVDYLQLLSSTRRRDSRQQEVSDISRELKVLAKELHVRIIAMSQLSREVEKRGESIPMLSDLRDSGAIEQDADIIMFIYRADVYKRAEPYDHMAQLILAKQRNGPTGEVRLAFQHTYARFDTLAHGHAPHAMSQGA